MEKTNKQRNCQFKREVVLNRMPTKQTFSFNIKEQKGHITVSEKHCLNSNLRVSSVQYGLSSPADRSFAPKSRRSLLLRSSSIRLEDGEVRIEDRALQLLSERLQPLSLKQLLLKIVLLFHADKTNTLYIILLQKSLK